MMIAEVGIENFSVRRLCQRAGVAQRTLYNAFHNKDRLIALAISEAYNEFNRSVRYNTAADTLIGVIERTITVNRPNFLVRNYAMAVVSLYFGLATPPDVWKTLREISISTVRPWLSAISTQQLSRPRVDVERFAGTMANLQYATLNDWCLDRHTDDEYMFRLVENMLLVIVGAVQGDTLNEAEQILTRLRISGKIPKFASTAQAPALAAELLELR